MPESARCTSRIWPASLPTTAPTATFGVTYPGTPSPTVSSHSWTKWPASRLDLEVFLGRGPDVGRHLQHLFEPLPLVQALREAEAGARDARERFTPTQQLEREVLGSRGIAGV